MQTQTASGTTELVAIDTLSQLSLIRIDIEAATDNDQGLKQALRKSEARLNRLDYDYYWLSQQLEWMRYQDEPPGHKSSRQDRPPLLWGLPPSLADFQTHRITAYVAVPDLRDGL